MMFFELLVPRGALSDEKRRDLARRLLDDFMTPDEMAQAPPGTVEAGKALEQVVVHQIDDWVVGDRFFEPGDRPRYMVRVSLPAVWHDDMREEVVKRVNRIIASVDDNPSELEEQPIAWVHVVAVPEGGLGGFGKVMTATDLVRWITADVADVDEAPPGFEIDPVCKMTVPLNDNSVTYEHDGKTYAFCATACRDAFIEDVTAEPVS